MPNRSDKLVSKEEIDAVRNDLRMQGRLTFQGRLRQTEPDLYDAINLIALNVLTDVGIIQHGKLHDRVYGAVWQATLLGLISYSRAIHRLCAETSTCPPWANFATDDGPVERQKFRPPVSPIDAGSSDDTGKKGAGGRRARPKHRTKRGLVSSELLVQLRREKWPKGLNAMLADLSAVEPDLTASIRCSMASAMKMLDTWPVPPCVRRPLQDFVTATAVVSVEAIRQSTFHIWQQTEVGQQLEQYWSDLGEESPRDSDAQQDGKDAPGEE